MWRIGGNLVLVWGFVCVEVGNVDSEVSVFVVVKNCFFFVFVIVFIFFL